MNNASPDSYLLHGDAETARNPSSDQASARSTRVRVRPAMLLTQRIAAQRMISLASSSGKKRGEGFKSDVKPLHLRRRGITASRMVLPAGTFPKKR